MRGGGEMKPLEPAKLTRPISRTALPRERLFELIEQNSEKKVIWISGPAGSGKTTLASSYFRYRGVPCIWYQLDGGDADISTFFYYMREATRHANARHRTTLPLLTPEYLQGIPVFAKRFFEQVCKRLIGRANLGGLSQSANPAIVFDDYQEVPYGSVFHTVLNAGLSSIPQGVNVIILSRVEPPAAFARLRAAGDMGFLSWEDMRLTPDESDAIAVLKTGKDLNGETLSVLRRAADGWVAGLILLLENLRMRGVDFQLPGEMLSREEIFAYFATELFDRSAQHTRDFLLETSFLPKMSACMAEELTGNPNASRLFYHLSRKNYFISKHATNGQVFQYHPLFREFLLEKARQILAPERLSVLVNGAAKVLEENEHIEDAVSLLMDIEDFTGAIRLILTHAPALLSQGRWQTLLCWIDALPKTATERNPWLLYWMGASMLPASSGGSKECFAKAFGQFRSEGNAEGSFLALAGLLDSVTLRFDTFLELDKLIPLVQEILGEYPSRLLPAEIESRIVASMLYALVLRQPGNPAFAYWEERGLALVDNISDLDTVLRILLALACQRASSGELEKVPFILDTLHKRVVASHYAPLSVVTMKGIEAFYYCLIAEFDKSQDAAEDGLALADSTGIHSIDVILSGHGAQSALSVGNITKANEFLNRMKSFLELVPTTFGNTFTNFLMALIYLINNSFNKALEHANLAIKFVEAMGIPWLIPHQYLIKAVIMHKLKNDNEASACIAYVRELCSKIKLHQAEFMTFLVDAQIAFDNGKDDAGRVLLRKAMEIGREHGYMNGLFWMNSTMASLCAKALEHGIETEYVRHLVRARNLLPGISAFHLADWPWPLKIHTLGQFEIIRDSEALRFEGKVQQKPLLLLKALIAFGGRAVSEEKLSDALWPDAQGDLAHLSFETTLHRLRKLIGKDKLIFQEGRLTFDTQSCWVDALAFGTVLDKAEELSASGLSQADYNASRGSRTRAIDLIQSAIALYGGHLFAGEPEHPWMISPKERLRAKYLRAVQAVVSYWEADGEYEMAIRCCEKGLEIDDLAEELYIRLITCYQKMGLRGKAFSAYARYRSVLEAKLGTKPSLQMELFACK